MKAYRMVGWRKPPVLVDVPEPVPGPGEVRVRVGGSGACHSDLHVLEWEEGLLPWTMPFTLGHEVAGWVDAVGAGVDGFAHGEPVAVYGPWGCGRCSACRRSEENYCERAAQNRRHGARPRTRRRHGRAGAGTLVAVPRAPRHPRPGAGGAPV